MSAAQSNQPSANIRITLFHTGQSWVVSVIPETTLAQILNSISLDSELFNASAPNPYVFVNEGETSMPWLDRNMLDYNNWYIEHGFIPSLYIKRQSEITTNHEW